MAEIVNKTVENTTVENKDTKTKTKVKSTDKNYNIYFMKEIFNYVNTRKHTEQNIVIFNNELLEQYIKKQFIEVYLPQTYQMLWKQNKGERKTKTITTQENGKKVQQTVKTDFIEINQKFLQQFAEEHNLKVEQKLNYENNIKSKPKNEIKKYISEYLVKQLVDRMVLQYDKQDILQEINNGYLDENEQVQYHHTTIEPENVENKDQMRQKLQYKCEIKYGKFLSQVKDPLNELKSSYINMLNIILKNVNNQSRKLLEEHQEKDSKHFKIVEIDNGKKTKIYQLEVKGSGESFKNICNEIIHNVLNELQEKVIDVKEKKTQFCINKKSFEKLAEIYNAIINYKEEITETTYDITTLTTFINRRIKSYVGGVSIPVTQYYIKQYLPTIISFIINRLDMVGKKVEDKSLFKLDTPNPDIINGIEVNIFKIISYVPKKVKEEEKEDKPKKEKQPKKDKPKKDEQPQPKRQRKQIEQKQENESINESEESESQSDE